MTAQADPLREIWATPPGLLEQIKAVNHRAVGVRFIITAFVFFIAGGIMALLMRIQLGAPESTFLDPDTYNQLFTMHGTTMMFLFAVPIGEGFAVYVVPLMVGARDMPFPRLNAFGYWCFLFGGVLLLSSFLGGVAPNGGWFAYVPLTGPIYSPGVNLDFWLLGVTFVEISGLVAAVELVVLILKQRAPGMAVNRVPLFVWAVLVTSLMIIFAFPALMAASVLLELDRKIGTEFYNPAAGGDPILWQHLFWIFGHPEVYIQVLPGLGMVSVILPTFARAPMAGYVFLALSFIAIGFLSFGVWVHHMFATGLQLVPLAFFSAASHMITVPSGVQVFAWLATLWRGGAIWRTPFLFVLGFILIFVLGGLTGVMVAVVPFDWQVHDSFFVVAHFHYVLIGGVVFPVLAAFHYWWPKMTGRMLSERLGVLSFWPIFIGFNLTFFPMHILGFLGMPRRVYTYLPDLGWDELNFLATLGAFILALGVLLFTANLGWSLRRGAAAGDNPWRGGTLEWATTSPPPPYNFRVIPVIGSRDPLWDGGKLHDEPPEDEAFRVARPEAGRETLATSVVDAQPEALVPLPNPSLVPLALAAGVALMVVGFLLDEPILLGSVVGLGAAISATALVAWFWPELRSPGSEPAGPATAKPPAGVIAPRSTTWWGMLFTIIILAVLFASVLFGYFLLRNGASQWPPDGVPRPPLDLASVATVVLLASAVPQHWAVAAVRRRARVRMRAGLSAALFLGVLFLGLQVVEYARPDFSFRTNAYGSFYFGVLGAHTVMLLVGLGINAFILTAATFQRFRAERHVAVQNAALYWYWVIAAWLLAYGTVYLTPYLWGA